MLVGSEINVAVSYNAIMTFFQLTLRHFVITLVTPANDSRTLRSSRTGRTPSRFAVGSIHLLLFFFVGFKPIPIFVLAFIAAQTVAATFSLRVESR